ncbi:alpha/beta-hydrolase [Auricularia subglabra TFB-10046 SS5]|nr:alpha/beta-hydrolase [Auricularia subglabra TFB-10046 SS5]
MEIVAGFTETAVFSVLEQTRAAFAPLVKHDEINAVPRKTFAYGLQPRHQLDVYYPAPREDGQKPPIVQFVYGGGMVSGERASPDGWYQNVGAFWAKQGYVAVIADYRLVPNVMYPGGASDVRDAMAWAVENLAGVADVSRYFIIGHSAGGTHVATMLGHPLLMPDDLIRRLKAVVLICPMFDYPTEGRLAGVALQYCGTAEAAKLHNPQALLEAVPSERAALWPPIRLIVSQFEDLSLVVTHQLYLETLRKKGIKVDEAGAKGHNHISINMAPMSGQGEDWAHEVDKWFKSF